MDTQSNQVKLNVGGHKFTTTLETIRSRECMLSTMFSGRFDLQADDKGYYFIDRDGTHFRYILNYLRDGYDRDVNING